MMEIKKRNIPQSSKKALKLKVLAKKKESVLRDSEIPAKKPGLKAAKLAVDAKQLVATSEKLPPKVKKLAVSAKHIEMTAKKKKSVKRKLVGAAKKLQVKAEKLAVNAKKIPLKAEKLAVNAKQLAVTAKEKEIVRRKLAVAAKKLAVTAKEKESVRRRLVVTAEKLAVTAKERESIRRRLAVTAAQLAVYARERESVRRRLVVTAEKLAITAQERENVRRRLVVTAEKLAVTAKEKEGVRRKLAVTANQLRLKAKQLAVTAKERESVRRRLVVTAKNLSLKAKQLAVTAKEKETVRHKLAETAKDLEQIRARNDAMLEGIGDGLVATDKNERILLVNKAFEKILGWKEGFVKGKFMYDIMPMVDEQGTEIPASQRPITMTIREHTTTTTTATTATKGNKGEKELAVQGEKTPSGIYYYVRKDKTKFPVAVTVAPMRVGGKIIGAIEVFRDITREKEIDKAKSEFITLASHQLKTPPTAIKLLTERLLGGKIGTFTEKQKEYFDDIHSSNQRMIDLVNALLNVSRIELGAFNIKVNEKDAGAIVQSILDELKPVIDKKQLKLKTTYPDKNILLMLDESLFRMAITNLVTNSIRYTAEGGDIRVLCKVVSKGQIVGEKRLEENSFVVEISDTGYGIPQKDQGKLFTKFFRADNARAKLPDGTGLGLYIVKSVLDHSGGLIWFTSRENAGSSFYVSVPMTGMRAKSGEKELVD